MVPNLFLFFGAPGIKMTFQIIFFRHHVALMMGFLSSVDVFFVAVTTWRLDHRFSFSGISGNSGWTNFSISWFRKFRIFRKSSVFQEIFRIFSGNYRFGSGYFQEMRILAYIRLLHLEERHELDHCSKIALQTRKYLNHSAWLDAQLHLLQYYSWIILK